MVFAHLQFDYEVLDAINNVQHVQSSGDCVIVMNYCFRLLKLFGSHWIEILTMTEYSIIRLLSKSNTMKMIEL